MKPKKEYIGDGVYAEMNVYGTLRVTTEDGGVTPTNEIYLEPQVWSELVAYRNRAMIALKEEREAHANRR
jgi:hypothetical protein